MRVLINLRYNRVGFGTARLQSLAKGEPFGLFTKFQKEVLEGNF